MTSIEWGIGISNQRRGERGSGRGRAKERDKKRDILLPLTNQRGGGILKGSRASKSERKREWKGEEHKEGNNVHLWFWWKPSHRWGHLYWHIFAVHGMPVFLVIFHISLRVFVLHGPLESLTKSLVTATTHQYTPMQLSSPPRRIFITNFRC